MTDGESAGTGKWRCAWCDKPHDQNDPPCDNCGHHKFEKAVVPVAPDDPDHVREPVWVCQACGRQHQKNSPPCSRCGNANLEKRIPSDEDFAEELAGTSYFDVLEPRYVVGIAFALVAGAVLVLALLGFVTLPGMDGGIPTVQNVPGTGTGNTSSGVALADVERRYLDGVNDRRADEGLDALTRDDGLDEVATFLNQRRVKRLYTDDPTPEAEGLRDPLREACGESEPRLFQGSPSPDSSAFESADALAAVLVDEYAADGDTLREATVGHTGLDVHVAPDDRVFVMQITC